MKLLEETTRRSSTTSESFHPRSHLFRSSSLIIHSPLALSLSLGFSSCSVIPWRVLCVVAIMPLSSFHSLKLPDSIAMLVRRLRVSRSFLVFAFAIAFASPKEETTTSDASNEQSQESTTNLRQRRRFFSLFFSSLSRPELPPCKTYSESQLRE